MAAPLESSNRDVVVDDFGNSPLLLPSFVQTDNAPTTTTPNLSAEGNPIVAGACAYRELTTGVECGCRSFWKFNGNQIVVQEENCACGHHACFHDQADVSARLIARNTSGGVPTASAVGKEVVGHLKEVGRLLSGLSTTENNAASDQAAIEMIHSTTGLAFPELASPLALVEETRENIDVEEQEQQREAGGIEGLGLMLKKETEPVLNDNAQIPQSQMGASSVNSESVARAIQRFLNESPGPWGRAVAMEASNEIAEADPSVHQLLPPLSVGDYRSLPGFEDILQSATELATPSIGNQTPDMNNIQPSVIKPRSVPVESPLTGPKNSRDAMPPPDAIVRHGTPRIGNSRPNVILTPSSQALSPPPFLPQDSANLAQVAHHLSVLNKYISNHGSQIKGLVGRLDLVERSSFLSQTGINQDMTDKLDHIEARVIDVESKIDDHAKTLWRGDSDVPSSDIGERKRQHFSGSQAGSEASRSLTGGQLVQTIETRVAYLEDRLLSIERCLPPSLNHPYQVEVVFLPWGRHLRGIWIEDHSSSSRFNTQDSEDWANARNVQSSSRFSVMSSTEPSGNVWDRQAIYDWAENTAEWLVPRACGVKSVAYHRLKSRGFVRTVDWTRPGAREIQDSITKAFGDIIPIGNEIEHDDDAELDEKGKNFWGLQAPFIPLRKVRGSSKLCFLAQPEMVTSALWTAEFLVSSALMKAVGGLRRLFITEKESYLQRPSRDDQGWTWARIQELPRYPVSETGIDSHWDYHQILDAPSIHSSFASQDSSHPRELEMSKSNSGLESPIKLKSGEHSREQTKTSFVPITPVTNPSQDFNFRSNSEFPFPSNVEDAAGVTSSQATRNNALENSAAGHTRYNLRRHGRAVSNPQFGQASAAASTSMLAADAQIRSFSASLAADAAAAAATATGSSKRVRGFDIPSNPLLPTIPNFVHSPKATKKSSIPQQQQPTPLFPPYLTPRTIGSRSNSGNLSLADTVLIEQGSEAGAGRGSGSTNNKRRRISHSRRRSMSVLSSVPAVTKPGISTPGPGPYATPFSGNFAAFSESVGIGNASNNDAESWKGVDEGHDHDADEMIGTEPDELDMEEEDNDDDDDMFSDDSHG